MRIHMGFCVLGVIVLDVAATHIHTPYILSIRADHIGLRVIHAKRGMVVVISNLAGDTNSSLGLNLPS